MSDETQEQTPAIDAIEASKTIKSDSLPATNDPLNDPIILIAILEPTGQQIMAGSQMRVSNYIKLTQEERGVSLIQSVGQLSKLIAERAMAMASEQAASKETKPAPQINGETNER